MISLSPEQCLKDLRHSEHRFDIVDYNGNWASAMPDSFGVINQVLEKATKARIFHPAFGDVMFLKDLAYTVKLLEKHSPIWQKKVLSAQSFESFSSFEKLKDAYFFITLDSLLKSNGESVWAADDGQNPLFKIVERMAESFRTESIDFLCRNLPDSNLFHRDASGNDTVPTGSEGILILPRLHEIDPASEILEERLFYELSWRLDLKEVDNYSFYDASIVPSELFKDFTYTFFATKTPREDAQLIALVADPLLGQRLEQLELGTANKQPLDFFLNPLKTAYASLEALKK